MHCTHCGICCQETEMLLCEADISLLEETGHKREDFVRCNGRGFARLRNSQGHCVFYDAEKSCCKVYRLRPLGCRIYPVLYSEEEGVVVDNLCPKQNTVSENELQDKGRRLQRLLKTIDEEAEKRRLK